MVKTLWISLAQVATALVVAFVCLTAARSVANERSGPFGDISDGLVVFILAAMVLTPLGAMIIGPLVAERLGLANCGVYSLSVLAVVVLVVFGAQNPDLLRNVGPLSLILTTLNLVFGYCTGVWPKKPRRY